MERTREELSQATGTDLADDGQAPAVHPELERARQKLEKARERMLSAAVAFCDGMISDGQMRAVREMLREQEVRVAELENENPAPFVQEDRETPVPSPAVPTEPIPDPDEPVIPASPTVASLPLDEELRRMLARVDEKIARLETDFQQGHINASQYRAIRRHYREQHEVALRLHQSNPRSDRWRVVLEEGKTAFLMQLNEAECRCIAFYELASKDCIYHHGELPEEAEEAMRFLSTFGQTPSGGTSGRMFATQTEDGANLILIPGRFTAALVAFSEEPPGWQVRALREVLRNFEAANGGPLSRGERQALVFPNLARFFRD
jgi:hypothetical protein